MMQVDNIIIITMIITIIEMKITGVPVAAMIQLK
jgi:hypothetical protein